MTSSAVTAVPESVLRMSVASLFPRSKRDRVIQIWLDRLPLVGVLVVQSFASLRLHNTAFQDEALYIYTGHWERSAWAGGPFVYTHPESFFSGAPQLCPVFASYLDSIGGLWLARLFSLLCMLSATAAVYWATRVLFAHRGGRVAFFAALAFSLSAPVIFLGNFATFDAPSFACIAWAVAVSVWSSKLGKSLWWSVLIGGLLVLAVALKYASAIDVPFVLLLSLLGLQVRRRRARALVRGLLAGTVFLAGAAVSALTWARSDVTGVRVTTLARTMDARTPELTLVKDVVTWSGPTLALMLIGGVVLALRRQPVIAVVLTVGTFAAVAFQIHNGDLTSLHKHVTLGLVLGAPLAGVALAEMTRLRLGTLLSVGLLWLTFLVGLAQSRSLFEEWPNTQGLVQTIQPSLAADPYIRTVGDIPEPVEYALWNQSQPWQWTGTYAGSFGYKGLTGVAAFRAALKANYFQLAYFNESSDVSQQLIGEMPGLGFHKTATVRSDGSTWTIWQRFDSVSN